MNLIVAPGADLFATAAAPGGLVPRPPGEGWSLAGLEVSHDFVRGGEGQLRVVYFWTRSKMLAEFEAGGSVKPAPSAKSAPKVKSDDSMPPYPEGMYPICKCDCTDWTMVGEPRAAYWSECNGECGIDTGTPHLHGHHPACPKYTPPPKSAANMTEGGGLIAAAEVLAKGGSLSKAAKAAAGDAQKGKS